MADMDVTAKFRADISDMQSKMNTLDKGLGRVQERTGKVRKGFTILKGAAATAIGGGVVAGAYAAGKALGDFAMQSVDAASSMEELQSKVNAIFGAEAGADIAAWSEGASKAFGQSQIQAQNAASTFAIFGKSAGLAGGDLTGFATGLTELSSDLASFYDASPEEAIGAIGAALRGESEPIRRFGVLLDDATLRQKALELGLVKTTKDALQPQQRVLAAQAAIMEQTADAQGDFARTSDGLANTQRSLAAVIEDVKTEVGQGLLPAMTSIMQAVAPMIQQLAGPLGQVAEQIGTTLANAFEKIAPVLPQIAETFGQIAQTVGGALVKALGVLLPALEPVLGAVQTLAAQLAPLLSKVLGKLAQVFGRVLGAVTPLLEPLIELVMGILDAAWPIVEVVADALLTLVDALTPVLDAVVMLIKPLGDLIKMGLAVLLPIIKPILPVIEVLANVLGQVLVKAIGLLMIQVGALIQVWSKVAPFILRNVAKPVLKHFMNMAEGVVGAAARMLGWVPGLGGALKDAEAAVKEFAAESQVAVENAADTIAAEGTRIGQEMVTQGQNALSAAAPALGAAAAQTGRYVAGQYNYAVASGMGKAFSAMGADVPAPAPAPEPSPDPAPSPSGTPSGASAASKQEEERLNKIQKFVDGFQKALERMQRGQDTLLDSTKRVGSEFATALGDMLPESALQQAFGPGSTIEGVVSQYDQLDAAITDLYKPLTNAKRFGKETAKAARGLMNDAKGFLKAATETALSLMAAKERNVQAIEDLDRDYATAVDNINDHYDQLDKAAADNLAAIESRWDKTIATLEDALDASTQAFDRENKILDGLLKERDSFLNKIASGFRKFVNDFSIEDGGSFRAQLEDRLTQVRDFARNIRTLIARGLDPTLVQEFVGAGVSGAGAAVEQLASASSSELSRINQVQAGLTQEVARFQEYASQQWFDAGIAQQEAIVAPLAAARDQAQAALNAANTARANEIAAARAHIETLKQQRKDALDAAKADYERQRDALVQQGKDIDLALQTNADNLHDKMAGLQESVPPEMMKAGKKSIADMLKGFQEKFPGMKRKLNRMMDRLAASMNRTATVTITHRTVFETQKVGFMAKGGPVRARDAYVVGEKGPELFVPSAAGNIIPNHKLGSVPNMVPGAAAGGAGTTINLTVNAGMGADGAEVGRHVVDALKRYERRNGPIPVTTR